MRLCLLALLIVLDVGTLALALAPNVGLPELTANLAHVFVAAVNVFAIAFLWPRWRLLGLASVIALAAMVEWAQLVIPGRTGSVSDLLLDGIGAACAWGLAMAVARLQGARRDCALRGGNDVLESR